MGLHNYTCIVIKRVAAEEYEKEKTSTGGSAPAYHVLKMNMDSRLFIYTQILSYDKQLNGY